MAWLYVEYDKNGFVSYLKIRTWSDDCQLNKQATQSHQRSNSPLHFSHLHFSSPGGPIRKTFPIVLQIGHSPTVAFFGPDRMIFCVFLRPICLEEFTTIIKFSVVWLLLAMVNVLHCIIRNKTIKIGHIVDYCCVC